MRNASPLWGAGFTRSELLPCPEGLSIERRGGTAEREAETEPIAAGTLAQHLGFVWRVMRWMGVRETDLEDATQRVFLIAVSKLDRIRPGSERAYLYSTAVRLARRIRRSPREMGSEPDALELVDPGATPEAALEHRQSVALLDRVLERLPDELKEVFLLCEVEELTMREVSELLAVPPGTVASRRRRAREELRRGIERAKAQVQRRGHL